MCRELTIESKTKKSRCCGFTLTEVIVASALLITAIVPILKALTSVHVHAITIERKTKSLNLAQAKLDYIKARSIYKYNTNFKESDVSLDGSYRGSVIVTPQAPNLKMITVVVGYDVDNSSSLSATETLITLETLIANIQ